MNAFMKKSIFILGFALAILAAGGVFSGCENSFGVYDQIQSETKQSGTETFKNTLVKALADDGASFYAAMSKVYERSHTAGSSWSLLRVPLDGTPTANYYALGLVGDGSDKIWVAALDASSDVFAGIFEYSRTADAWTELDSSALSAKSVDSLFFANNTLFVATHGGSPTTYGLYYLTGGAVFASALSGSATDSSASSFKSVLWDGSSFWAVTANKVYAGASAGVIAVDASAGTPSGKTIGGMALSAEASKDILITTSEGNLYKHPKDGAWASPAAVKSGVSLGDLVEVDTAPGKTLLIENLDSTRGYFEYRAGTTLEGGNAASLLSPVESGYATAIAGKPINAFLYATSVPAAPKNTLLIALAAQGSGGYSLYSNEYDGSAWSGWVAE